MSNIPNEARQAAAEAKAAIVTERRHLAARLIAWLRAHPHIMLAVTATVVVIAVALGVLRG